MALPGDTTAPCLLSVLGALSDTCATAVWRSEPGAENEIYDHKEMLGTYNVEGYSSMTLDSTRNSMYEHAINRVIKEGGARKWLEIGPGAHLCLTKLVTKASSETMVCGIEVNERAVQEALAQIRSCGLLIRVKLVKGLSTDHRVLQEVRKIKEEWGSFQGVVQELLGFFAGSEGAAYIMSRVHKDILTNTPVVQVPSRAATFFCPVLVGIDHVAHSTLPTTAVYYVPNAFALVRRLPIQLAALSTGGTGSDWLKAGLIEFLDFNQPKELARYQTYITTFKSTTPAQINALACWIWIETYPRGAPRRLAKTGYPWGVTDAPKVEEDCIAMSSREDDDSACASNWRNVLIDLRKTLYIPANTEVRVEVSSNLESKHPTYRFTVHVG